MVVRYCGCLLTILALGTFGCSKDESTPVAGSATNTVASQPASPTAGSVNPQSPAECVQLFLDAVRKGDDKTSGALLTKVALQKTSEANLQVAPPGSNTAKFEIGQVEMKKNEGEEGAYVASKWTDVGEDGQPHTDEIIWMVVKDPEGWRIVGMAVKVFADLEPVFLNFEDPADMVAKQQGVEQEMRRRASVNLPPVGAPGSENLTGTQGNLTPTNGQIPVQNVPGTPGTPAQAQLPSGTDPAIRK